MHMIAKMSSIYLGLITKFFFFPFFVIVYKTGAERGQWWLWPVICFYLFGDLQNATYEPFL